MKIWKLEFFKYWADFFQQKKIPKANTIYQLEFMQALIIRKKISKFRIFSKIKQIVNGARFKAARQIWNSFCW